MILIKNIQLISFFAIITLFLNGCNGKLPGADARKFPADPEKRVEMNLKEGRGFRLSDQFGKSRGGVFDFANSNGLWRASLDVIDFMPLTSVNYSGGIIITDWYSEKNSPNKSIKISIRFLTNEIRSDALKVIIHKKKCASFNNCKIVAIENSTNNEIKFAILKKAAQLQKQDLAKTKEKNSDYKLPKEF